MTTEKKVNLNNLTEDQFQTIFSEYLKRAAESDQTPILTSVEYAAVGFEALSKEVLVDVIEGRFQEKTQKSTHRKGWGKR